MTKPVKIPLNNIAIKLNNTEKIIQIQQNRINQILSEKKDEEVDVSFNIE